LRGTGRARGALLRTGVDALTTDEARDLAITLIGADSPDADTRVDWVVEESGGSALFIYELVQHLQAGMEFFEAGKVHLDEILWTRIQRLPEQPRHLLEVVAVASRPLPLRHVQEVAQLRVLPPEMVAALRSERLVRTTGPGLDDEIECFHDRIRESIAARLPKAVVAGYHAALAAALERDGGGQPELLAAHFEGAGETAKAGGFYRLAADQAVEALAFDRAEDFYQRALSYAVETSTKAEILERLVHFYTDLARFDDAYRAGREGASLYGIRLPAKFHPPSFVVDLVAAKVRLGRREVADILDLQTMDDERLAGAVRLIGAVAKAAYQVRPELCVAINARMVNLCLQHGNTADSAIGYMVFGSIFLGGILGNHRRGYEFGRLALDLVEKYINLNQKAEVHFVVGYFGTSWLRPATEAEELWRTAHESGLETGDLFHTGCASCATTLSYFMRGVAMERILETSYEYLELLDRVGLSEPAGAVTAVRQAVRNLQGSTRSRGDFSEDNFDEAAFVESLADFGSRHFAHYYFVVKMQTLYLWGDVDAAIDTLHAAQPYLKDSKGMLHSAEHRFYEALILAASCRSATASLRRSGLRTIRKQHRLLQKWAAQCPHNFLHKERLVAGELARLSGDPVRAVELYLEARRAAADDGYQHIEALAHQLAASALRDLDPTAAASHLEAACALYRRWGASAFADSLEDAKVSNEIQS
jgi:tetratricopeptide (TPR) repeat protein